MSDDRSQMMLDILLGILADVVFIKRELVLQGGRLTSIEDQVRRLRLLAANVSGRGRAWA